MQFGAVWAADCSYLLSDWGKKVGREVTADDVEILTWALAEMGKSVTAAQLVDAVTEAMKANREAAALSWDADGDGFDLLLTPTLGEPPVAHGTFDSTPGGAARRLLPLGRVRAVHRAVQRHRPARRSACRCTGTTTGCRSASQLVAAFGREDLLLRVAAQLEAAQPWIDRRPPVYA